jgi:hypothetical protein
MTDVPLFILSGFLECLALVLAVSAFSHGRRLYGFAVFGLGIALVARLADGFMSPGPDVFLKVLGYGLAALALLVDILFEQVEVPDDEPRRILPPG